MSKETHEDKWNSKHLLNSIKSDVQGLLTDEIEKLDKKFPVFHSGYEGVAVLYEKVENIKDHYKEIDYFLGVSWSHLIQDRNFFGEIAYLKKASIELICQAILLSIVAKKFFSILDETEET